MNTLRLEPTLFIFVGTSPAQIGWRIKKQLDNAYGELPIFRYFWLDTDSNVEQNALDWLKSGYVRRVEVGNFNSSVVLQNLENYPTLKSWWPGDSKLKPGHLGRGAHQIRSVGRLSLFRMFNDSTQNAAGSFYTQLENSISDILSVDNKQKTRSKLHDSLQFDINENRARIILVFSTCGGTGSGTAFDVAYLCRDILSKNSVISSITGVAILPPVIEKAMRDSDQQQKAKIKANTYAWFKENDFLINNQSWNVTYPGEDVSIKNMPFDINFVVDISNQKGQFLNSEHDVFKMIAQSLFLIASSSIAADADSMQDNMGITNETFQNRVRSYSAFSTAALIFPKERIKNYCGAKLAEEVIRIVCERPKQISQNQISSATLISKCGLGYQRLLDDLTGTKMVRNDNLEFIQSSQLPGEALSKITDEITNDQIELSDILNGLKQDEKRLKSERKTQLRASILDLLRTEGPGYVGLILDKLVEETSTKAPTSLNGNRKALVQFGISAEAIEAAKQELEAHKKELSDLTANFGAVAFKAFLPKEWKERFRRAKNNCISAMELVNTSIIKRNAELSALAIYDELLVDLQDIRVAINNLTDAFKQSADLLKADSEQFLDVPATQMNLFELTHEVVDKKYIQDYYQSHCNQIDRLTLYQQFIEQQATFDYPTLAAWNKTNIANAVSKSAAAIFAPELDKVSILEAIKASYPDHYADVLKKKLDGLVEYCHPFWRFTSDSGLDPLPQGPSFLGIQEADTPLLPDAYRDHQMYRVVSTGIKDTIHLVKILHGVPASLLSGMSQWKQHYDKALQNGLDPLHIFPGAREAEEVIPERDSRPRSIFAYAMAFGYITKRSTHYYFDPDKRYTDLKVRPDTAHKIAEGRINAEKVFIQHLDWVETVEDLVDLEIQKIGNIRAVDFLKARIKDMEGELYALDAKSPSREQLKNEIKALQSLITKLNIAD